MQKVLTDNMNPCITIACSGLGHVHRGSETWAQDLAEALHGAGLKVRLMGGGPLETGIPYERVRVLSRGSMWLRGMNGHWRYLLEQWSFTAGVVRRLRASKCDVVHVSDPQVGWWLREKFRNRGPGVFYRDGLMLGPDWLWRFDHVQVLAPHYQEQAMGAGCHGKSWHMIPHFVDTARFHPGHRDGVHGGDRSPVLLAVGDLAPTSKKRLDYVIDEVAALSGPVQPRLWIAGQANQPDAERLRALGRGRLGDRFRLLPNLPRSEMPKLYQSADLMIHAALREPFGMVLLEAMASGLPIVAHNFPVTSWIVGDGGEIADLQPCGALTAVLARMTDRCSRRVALGEVARRAAETRFTFPEVLPRYLRAYREIATHPRPGSA